MEKQRTAGTGSMSGWRILDAIGAVLAGTAGLAALGVFEGTPLWAVENYVWPLLGLGVSFAIPSTLYRLRWGAHARHGTARRGTVRWQPDRSCDAVACPAARERERAHR